MSACPCPNHPMGCYGHPHACGCSDRKKTEKALMEAMRKHIAVDPDTLSAKELREHVGLLRDAYAAVLALSPEGQK